VRLRLELDGDTTGRLIEQAVVEQRPVARQAEVLLRKALDTSLLHIEKGEQSAKDRFDRSAESMELDGG
jgi:uncharacterized membrane protein affecting hemolysin expression